MAITRTQIAKQLLANGGRTGFFTGMREQEQREQEQRAKRGPRDDPDRFGPSNKAPTEPTGKGEDNRSTYLSDQYKKPTNITREQLDDRLDRARDFRETLKFKKALNKKTLFDRIPNFGFNLLGGIFPSNQKYTKEFLENNPQMLALYNSLSEDEKKKVTNSLKGITNKDGKTYEDFLAFDKGAPGLKYAGDVGGLDKYVSKYEINPDGTKGKPLEFGYRQRDDYGEGRNATSDYERRLRELEQSIAANPITSPVEEDEIINYRLMADGGRIGFNQGSFPTAANTNKSAIDLIPGLQPSIDNLQNVIDSSTDQNDYFKKSTSDMIQKLSEGYGKAPIVGPLNQALIETTAPVLSAVTSPLYDGYEAYQRMEPGSGITGFAKAFDDEQPLDAIANRFIGAAEPLANRIKNVGTFLGEEVYDLFNSSSANADEVDDMKALMAKEAQFKKQKQQEENFQKIKEAQLVKEAAAAKEASQKEASQRAATKQQAAQNQASGTGGFQSSFAKDKNFMSGKGTAAEMGSFADGGRAGLAGGGMPYEGGIMDLESARQMYSLGKLVKKITRGVKKIAKSPIGKAALAFGAYKLASPFLLGTKGVGMDGGLPGFLFKQGLTKGGFGTIGGLTTKGILAGIGATSALSGLMTKEEDEEPLYAGADIDDPRFIMANYEKYLNPRLAANGGLMRTGYQEGSKEPVAKKVMPLLDMDGQEKDYRETGGFVDMGRMEKADDVPARLSKNEFVFTADAVRNAGEGNVDKGAEVMYNMMKNLESGGEVSEESQGLEGAREMFQTSQRLEEVL